MSPSVLRSVLVAVFILQFASVSASASDFSDMLDQMSPQAAAPVSPLEYLFSEQSKQLNTPLVESHTYQHQMPRNALMFVFIGFMMLQCTFFGTIYSALFDIQGWYWDCIDSTRTNLTLI